MFKKGDIVRSRSVICKVITVIKDDYNTDLLLKPLNQEILGFTYGKRTWGGQFEPLPDYWDLTRDEMELGSNYFWAESAKTEKVNRIRSRHV